MNSSSPTADVAEVDPLGVPRICDAALPAFFAIPNLVFENRTPLDATQFDTVDQHGSTFHVVVAKTAYRLGAGDAGGEAMLTALSPAAKLNVEDRYFNDDSKASVCQESDFAPYKPVCDVIVNATAYAPRGKSAPAFLVRLTVRPAVAEIPVAANSACPALIDKSLCVTGERHFKKKLALWRIVQWHTRMATLGIANPSPWRLTAPDTMTHLPLRYEYANGGECRIDRGDAAAAKVPDKVRLPRNPIEGTHTEVKASDPVAHAAFEANPVGRGFARRWYLDAKQVKDFPAPRISAEGKPLSVKEFWCAVNGKALPAPAGLGTVGRGWLPRRALIGTFDERATWGPDEIPRLPEDFDFAYYNCAPRDQQCPHMVGGEQFTLTNLCSPNHPSSVVDGQGNTVLRFTLPRQTLFLIAVDGSNKVLVERMVIDTVIVEPDGNRVDLVWRALLPTGADLRKARLLQISEAAQMVRLEEVIQLQEGRLDSAAHFALQPKDAQR